MKIFRNEISVKYPYPCLDGKNKFDCKSWPFLLEDRFTYVDKLEDADIIILNDMFDLTQIYKKLKRKQICLCLYIFHIDDHFQENHLLSRYRTELERYPNINLIFLHKNKSIPDQESLLYYDSMFNRHKLYFQDYDKIEKWKQNFTTTDGDFTHTLGTSRETFSLNKLEKDFSEGFKNILSPNLIYQDLIPPRMRYRAGLKGWINQFCKDKAITNEEGYLLTNNPGIKILQRFSSGKKDGGFWYPLADEYYNKSLFSVYVETLTMSAHDTRCVTEKTFDPLIKGNFVIPFSYPGFIKDLEDYGFLIPKIDVQYDQVENDELRFQYFLSAVKLVGNMTIDECKKFYETNKHTLEHNRNVFFTRPYHTMYDRLLERLNVIKNKANVSNL